MKIKDQSPSDYGRVVYRLGELIANQHLTVNDLARQTQMNPVVLQKSISGETWPSRYQIARVCKALNVQPGHLFTYLS